MIKSNKSLAYNKIKNKIVQLLLEYKHENNIHKKNEKIHKIRIYKIHRKTEKE